MAKRIIGKHWCGGDLCLETTNKRSVRCKKCDRISYEKKKEGE